MPKHLTVADETNFVTSAEVGVSNGVAGLGADGKVPTAQLPAGAVSPVASVNDKTGVVELGAADVGAVASTSVGQQGGVAPLDGSARLPVGYLPTTAVTTVNGHAGPTPVVTAADTGAVAVDTIVVNVRDHGATGGGSVDDTAAWQTAAGLVNTAGGGTVLVPPGNYKLNGTVHLGANTTVSAYGAYVFAGAGAGQPFLDNYLGQTSPTVYNGNGNISVLGGVWDAKGQTYTTDSADTMFFGHASNILCRDVTIRNTRGYHGIEYNAINIGQILNCRFEGYSTAGGSDPGEAIQIDVAIAGAGQPANDGTECQDITVDGCYMGPAFDGSGLGSYGALVGAHSAQGNNSYQGVRVVNSTAEGALHYGIHAYNWAKCQISNNTIVNSADIGILVDTQNTGGYQPDAIEVNGNSITGSQNYGLYVNGNGAFTTNYVADISIIGNTIRNVTGTTPTGIGISQSKGATVTGNTIYNCTTNGITSTYNTDITINSNTVHNCATGVSIAGTTTPTVVGNTLDTGTSNGIFLGQAADGVTNTTDALISSNHVVNYTNAAVRGGTSATNVTVVTNRLVQGANGTFGVELVSTNTGWSVYGNHLVGTWTLANALNTFNSTTKVTVSPDNKYGVRGANIWGTQLDPRLTTATVANTVTETVVGTFTIPAADAQAGGVYRGTVYGTASTTGTPTLTFKVRLGGVAGQVLATFPAITTASGLVTGGWLAEVRLMCLTNGASATWAASASLNHQIASLTAGASSPALTNGTVTVDSTVAETLVITATWSAASASNTVSSTAGLLYRDY